MTTRTAAVILTILVLAIGAAGAEATDGGIKWYSYADGQVRARESGRLMIIDFHADWCKYCKKMDKETFTDPAVITLMNERFVPISVDTVKESDTAGKFGVTSLPTMWFLESDGQPINQLPGFVEADMFRVILEYVSTRSFETIDFQTYLKAQDGQ